MLTCRNAFPSAQLRSFSSSFIRAYSTLIRELLERAEIALLDDAALHAVFDAEHLIEAELQAQKSQLISSCDIEITNADRKKALPRSTRKGNFGADAEFEADWAERVRKEKEQKTLDLLASSEITLCSSIADQVAATRRRCLDVVCSAQHALDAVAALSLLGNRIASQALEVILHTTTVWKVMTNELFAEYAQDCLQHALAAAIEKELTGSVR
jgi:hypothetical protein